jgi:hypothetical protein
MSADQTFIQAYMQELEATLKALPSRLQPDANQIKGIAEKDVEDIRDLIAQIGITDAQVNIQHASWISHNIHNPLKRLADGVEHTVNRNKYELCILGNIAVGAAIIAAWVSSGGTLTVGTAIGGIQITSPLLAFLAGGATGRGVAEFICKH